MLNFHRLTIGSGFLLFISIVAIPERFQVVNGTTALGAGIRLIPLLVASSVGSTIGSLVASRTNQVFYNMVGANCLLLLGSGLMSTGTIGTQEDTALYGYQVIFGFGIGATLSSTTITAAINSNYEDYGKKEILSSCMIGTSND